MNRRTWIKKASAAFAVLGFIFPCSALPDSGSTGKDKPNIVFVFADQLRSHALGCYGNEQVQTPNIDRLADQGVRFTNAISTAPVCGPYRGMLMSGNFPMKNGMVLTDHFLRNPTPYFAEVCKTAGYRTAYIGKWHLSGAGRDVYVPPERRCGFDFWRALECTHSYFESKYYHQDEKNPRTWPSYDAIAQTDAACEYIAAAKVAPFCLFLSWGPPHDPYEAPAKYRERFKEINIQMRENVNDFATAEKMWRECDTAVARDGLRRARLGNRARLSNRKSNAQFIEDYRGYYAAIEALDDCMGKIMAQLKNSGQLDNTILVFTSDHGDNLGSHRQIGKQLPFEESISIPLIIRYPEKIKAATVTDALMAPVDIMPTLLSLADMPCPEVDGKDISSAAMGNDADVQDAVLIMKSIPLSVNWIVNGNGAWRGVRTKRHTYARKSDTQMPWMLFDNKSDPYQMKNLVDDPAYAELLKKLDEKTNRLLIPAGDPEDPAVYAGLIQKERDEHGVWNRWKDLMPKRIKPGSEFGY